MVEVILEKAEEEECVDTFVMVEWFNVKLVETQNRGHSQD